MNGETEQIRTTLLFLLFLFFSEQKSIDRSVCTLRTFLIINVFFLVNLRYVSNQ